VQLPDLVKSTAQTCARIEGKHALLYMLLLLLLRLLLWFTKLQSHHIVPTRATVTLPAQVQVTVNIR
jgi:hypothetical protein